MQQKTLDEILTPAYEKLIFLFSKSKNEYYNDRDTRRKHFEILASDLAEQINLIKCFDHFVGKHPDELKEITNYSDENILLFIERTRHLVFSDFFLQVVMKTELFFRNIFSALNIESDINRVYMNTMFGFFFNDDAKNLQKENSKLCLMLWDARNSIHHSGVYSKTTTVHTYRGINYPFENGMAGVPFPPEVLVNLLIDLFDECYNLILDPRVKAIELIEHPFYKVFGK